MDSAFCTAARTSESIVPRSCGRMNRRIFVRNFHRAFKSTGLRTSVRTVPRSSEGIGLRSGPCIVSGIARHVSERLDMRTSSASKTASLACTST